MKQLNAEETGVSPVLGETPFLILWRNIYIKLKQHRHASADTSVIRRGKPVNR